MILNADTMDELSGKLVASPVAGCSEGNLDIAVVETSVSKGEEIDGTGDHENHRIEGTGGVIKNDNFSKELSNYCGCVSQPFCSQRRLRSSSKAYKLDSLFSSFARKKRGALFRRCRRSTWGSYSHVNEENGLKESNVRGNESSLPRIRLKVKISGDDVKNFVKPEAAAISESGSKIEKCNPVNEQPFIEDTGNTTFAGDVDSAAKDSDATVISSVSVAEIDANFSEIALYGNAGTKERVDASSPDSEVSNFVPNVILAGNCSSYNDIIVKPPKKREGRGASVTDTSFSEVVASPISGNGSSSSPSSKDISHGNAHISSTVDASKEVEGAIEGLTSGNSNCEELILKKSEGVSVPDNPKGQKHKKSAVGSKKKRANNSRPRSRKQNGDKKKGTLSKSTAKSKTKDKCAAISMNTDRRGSGKDAKTSSTNGICSDTIVDRNVPSKIETDQGSSNENAWVRCDDCLKWRRISEEFADSIGQSNRRWICGDNMDKSFGDCSVPQEMSNSEINAELGISDTEADCFDTFSNSLTSECSHTTDSREHEFVCISTNQFLHRKRKNQNIDEIMVCSCKAPADSGAGCNDGCLNRMLNIECIAGTCPCGDMCSNQQFQKRSYAKMQWARCGKKGYGLRLVDDISRGQFLIEYVGEVLDMRTYQSRLKEYAALGHKHFYFMTLDGSEVIDACGKGNLGRFINHSCDPNCRTEKWVVNGEICIGLFAVRDIKKGEELTFDYNYVRVVGAAAKQCYCGSPLCRGYIGGDPANAEYIDQVDSDEEFPEPIMHDEDDEFLKSKKTKSRAVESEETIVRKSEGCEKPSEPTENVESEIYDSHEPTANDSLKHLTSELPKDGILPNENKLEPDVQSEIFPEVTIQDEDVVKSLTVPPLTEDLATTTSQSHLSLDSASHKKSKSTSPKIRRVFVKSRFYVKSSEQPCMLKRGKHVVPVSISRKSQSSKGDLIPSKPKKLIEAVPNGRFEAVEEKLNELLDADGGISKRKDAPRGYLQLLHLTAASGSNGNGETIQSNRDLSLILDAILKTKSRIVLNDIIQKNVLQKLHNMVKQCRRDFKKIPILRKVLKVLEYLAIKEVLTLEHICRGPSHPGVESFIESMLSLTEHDDKQVFQIARNFRDKWIPRHARKIFFIDRDEEKRKHHCVSSHPAPSNPQISERCLQPCGTSTTTQRTRKRKTRWDQDKPVFITVNDHSFTDKSPDFKDSIPHDHKSKAHVVEDIPPGFSSFHRDPNLSTNVIVGTPQKKFLNRLPVAYGIPLAIVQQYKSNVAPGLPFYPFPPLPPSPHPPKDVLSSVGSSTFFTDDTPSTSSSNHVDKCSGSLHSGSKRGRDSMLDIDRKCFKQQKCKRPVPWLRVGWRWSNTDRASSKEKLASDKTDDHH